MVIHFYKYHSTGNDFILIDNRVRQLDRLSIELIQHLCNRRVGIGADGLILMQQHQEYAFEIIYYNADGSQSLCGNGSRCAVHLAQYWGIVEQYAHFMTMDGPYEAFITKHLICLKMHDVPIIQPQGDGYFLHTGAPHYVQWVNDLPNLDVMRIGSAIRYSQTFQKSGTNVNFVSLGSGNQISVRTYEKGVEGETLSCGTGAVAAALVATVQGLTSPIQVKAKGGILQVYFKKTDSGYKDIYLIGPAVMVFQGTIDTQNLIQVQ